MKKLLAAALALALCACGQGKDETGGKPAPDEPVGKPVTVLAFGDSLFAGYNLPRAQSYPARLEQALRGRGLNVHIRNAGVSGDTTGAGRQRLDFVLDSIAVKPDLALVELGANDMLRGLPPAQARQNLDAIMAELARRDIAVVVMGMRAAPNLGRDYARPFDAIYPDLADKYDAALVPFFIEPLIRDRSLVQADQVHPTPEGVDAMVKQSIDTIEDAIEDR